MVGKLFSGKPNPEVQALLRTLVPPEVDHVSDEAIDKASMPRAQGMLEILGFEGYSFMDAMMGQSEIRGMRHGRDVALYFGMSGSKPSVTTRVTVSAMPFEISFKDKDSRLETMGLPSGVLDVIRRLGPLDKDVTIEGSAGGITIDRKRSSKDAATWKGTVQWLSDIRLAESLADVFS